MGAKAEAVSPEYAVLRTRKDYSHIRKLQYPQNQREIARLSLDEKMVWYAAQDPQQLISWTSSTKRGGRSLDECKDWQEFEEQFERMSGFRRFWFWHYLLPLKLKRQVYRLKFW